MNKQESSESYGQLGAIPTQKKVFDLLIEAVYQQKATIEEINRKNCQFFETIEQQITHLQDETLDANTVIESPPEGNLERRTSSFIEAKNMREQLQEKIRELEITIKELERNLKHWREANDKHLQTIENLEIENERYREANRKQDVLISSLKEQILLLQKSNVDLELLPKTSSPKAISLTISQHAALHRKTKSVAVESLSHQLDQSAELGAFNQSQLLLMQEANTDKICNLTEKLDNEQAKNNDLSFIISNLKNANEFLIAENGKLSAKVKDLEMKIESDKEDFARLREINSKHKLKVDYLSTICSLLDQSVLDHNGKLAELPGMMVAYLRGEINEINFSNSRDLKSVMTDSPDVSYRKNTEDDNAQMKQIIFDSWTIEDTGTISKDMKEFKDTLKQILQAVEKLNKPQTPSFDKFTLKPVPMTSGQSTLSPDSLSKPKIMSHTSKHARSSSGSFFLSKAVENSNSLLWNIKANTQPVTRRLSKPQESPNQQ